MIRAQKQVYFIKPVGLDGPIKIGCTKFPEERLRMLAYWSPVPLEIVCMVAGDGKVEHALHRYFAFCHSHKEWFHSSGELVDLIAKLNGGALIADIIDLSRNIGRHPQWIPNGKSTNCGVAA